MEDAMANLAKLFDTAESAIDQLLDGISSDIQEFADHHDFETVSFLTKTASAVQASKKIIVEEHKRPGLVTPKGNNGSFRIQITEGALKNSYLNITEGLHNGVLKLGAVILLKLPNNQQVTTKVVPGNRLQERGLIAKFYQQEKIRAGDFLSMAEISPGTWFLQKV
jgi:hypothetical protein